MDTNLTATVRADHGKGAARKARAAGQLPAVIYGPDYEPKSVALDPVAFDTIFRHTRDPNTLLHLDIEGETVPALVREVQRHPLSRELLHVDLLHVSAARKVQVPVRIEAKGRPAGASLGGRVRIIRRTLNVACPFDAIPEKLYIDVTPMHIGDMRKASEIELPEGVELLLEADINIVTVYGKKGGGKKK
ncbi:MAG: 50S ribosomal protein L25 [Deltaproteobacteria bacterium]|nr:MAG: 50S ribosomal protein L25 [Deltaproteobacteria bacterium]